MIGCRKIEVDEIERSEDIECKFERVKKCWSGKINCNDGL